MDLKACSSTQILKPFQIAFEFDFNHLEKQYAFFSYGAPDRDSEPHYVATQFMVARSLGVPVWYDEANIPKSGKPNNEKIIQSALLKASVVVCFPSIHYVTRPWPCREYVSALHSYIPVLPIRPPDCYTENWLDRADSYQYIDSENNIVHVGESLSNTPGINRKSSHAAPNSFITGCTELILELVEILECKSNLPKYTLCLLFNYGFQQTRSEYIKFVREVVTYERKNEQWGTTQISEVADRLRRVLSTLKSTDNCKSMLAKYFALYFKGYVETVDAWFDAFDAAPIKSYNVVGNVLKKGFGSSYIFLISLLLFFLCIFLLFSAS